MKKLLSLVMFVAMAGAVFLPLQSASAGGEGPWIPYECAAWETQEALENGAELIYAEDYDGHVNAGSGNQVIIGTGGDDVIRGGSGNDVICGVQEDDGDRLYGGSGNDVLIPATDGRSDLYGQTGNDLFISDGWDAGDCIGGSGYDSAYIYCDGAFNSIEDH